jgi:hypothetical protein
MDGWMDGMVQPRSLSFCFKYNENSCCTPGVDAEDVELFTTLTGAHARAGWPSSPVHAL